MIPQHEIAEVRDAVTWLAAHGALTGVAAIVRERRNLLERHAGSPTRLDVEGALGSGMLARAGALIAAEIDQEGQP